MADTPTQAAEILAVTWKSNPTLLRGKRIVRRVERAGMDISIELDAGQYREHKDGSRTQLQYPYGYIRRTKGADGEHIDCYLGPEEEFRNVYVVRQMKPDTGRYDEDKVMIGFASRREAEQAYRSHYPSQFFGGIKAVPVEQFVGENVAKSLMAKGAESLLQSAQKIDEMLRQLPTMQPQELALLAGAVWGSADVYAFQNPEIARAELRGFLRDQLKWLARESRASKTSEPHSGLRSYDVQSS